MSEEVKILYPNLRAEIARRGLKHYQFAEMVGMSAVVFSSRLTGATEFDVAEITRICEVLGFSFEYLFKP